MRTIWLASYPKSGNTWMRMLIGALAVGEDASLDINKLPERGGLASARAPFDLLTMIDSGLLTHDEIDALRPRVTEAQARCAGSDDDENNPPPTVRFVKVHDAYTYLPNGEPLLAGAKGADGAVVIVRDPRDVASSFANHSARDIDSVIERMASPKSAFCDRTDLQDDQLRQHLLDWSGHVQSWLDQRDVAVHLVRYEDMIGDTAGILAGVLDFAKYRATADQIEKAVSLSRFSNLRTLEEVIGFGEASQKTQAGRFFRRGEAGAWREELTPEQVARIELAHAPVMTRLGYALSGVVPAKEGATAC